MSTADSRTAVPTGPPGEAVAVMEGVRFMTAMVNVSQAGGASGLWPHTVVGPSVPARSGVPVRNPVGASRSPGGTLPSVRE
jgi:hypothetical protein